MTDTTEDPVAPTEATTEVPTDPAAILRSLGYDPDAIRSLVITPTTVIAISADYSEPRVTPEEATA